jgi:hypothetical protein
MPAVFAPGPSVRFEPFFDFPHPFDEGRCRDESEFAFGLAGVPCRRSRCRYDVFSPKSYSIFIEIVSGCFWPEELSHKR